MQKRERSDQRSIRNRGNSKCLVKTFMWIKCLSFMFVSIQIPHNVHSPFLTPRTFQLVSLTPESPVMPSMSVGYANPIGTTTFPQHWRNHEICHLPCQPSPPLPEAPSCSSWQPIQTSMVSCGKKRASVVEHTRSISTDVLTHWSPYLSIFTRLTVPISLS